MEEKHLFRLASCMSAAEMRQRQEMLMRNQMMGGNPQVMGPGPQRMPAIPLPFEARFVERDLLPSTEIIAPADARQMHMASVPGHVNMLSNRVYTGPGYGFLQPESMDALARRQELLQKQNIARMEMEMNVIYQQKEIEKAHRKGLLDLETSFIYPGMQVNPVTFRGRHRLAEGHHPNDMYVHHSALDDLHGGAMLVANGPYPPIGILQRERGRRTGRRPGNHKSVDGNINVSKSQAEDKNMERSSANPTADAEKVDTRESDTDTDTFGKSNQSKMAIDLSTPMDEGGKDFEQGLIKSCGPHDVTRETNSCRNENGKDPNNTCSMFDEKFAYPPTLPLTSGPYGFPATNNNLLPTVSGAHNLYLNGDDTTSVEDIRKWTVDDVYNFVFNLPGCSEYAQVFKDHAIDGETLLLLTEEHLLDTMGLKLGPALKVRSQVSRRLGNVFYMMNLPLPLPLQSSSGKATDQPAELTSPINGTDVNSLLGSPVAQEPDLCKPSEVITSQAKDNQCDLVASQADFQMNFLKN